MVTFSIASDIAYAWEIINEYVVGIQTRIKKVNPTKK